MPEPEILRRCPVCGAASRPSALFCPQCGNAAAGAARGVDAPERTAQDAKEDAQGEPAPDASLQKRRLDSPPGGVRPRGGRLRKASSAVLDGATYDPSVRFLLVAAVLFVLFLVILLLSKFIT